MNKKSIVFSLSAAFIIIIAVIVYIAADRFLFEHIEIDLTKNKTKKTISNLKYIIFKNKGMKLVDLCLLFFFAKNNSINR